MQCPKCKKEIENNSLRCNYCGARVASLCKDCGTLNPIRAVECSNCKKKLLRLCSECGSANLPEATYCRKCGIEFMSEEVEKAYTAPVYFADMNSQQNVKAKLIDGIKDYDTRIITVSGESGTGKNVILRSAINELKNARLIWLYGSCTQTSQLSPFGLIQDMLLSFFNINNFCPDTLQLKKNSIKFFKQDFPTLTNNEIVDLLNLLYPENTDIYENIYFNKAKTFSIIKKVIFTILEKTKIIFIIDKFENIDGMSYDFFKELIKENLVIEKSKFIILNNTPRPGMGVLTSNELGNKNYLDLTIAPFTPLQIETYLKQFTNIEFGKDFTNLLIKSSGGNPAIIEQMVLLYNDAKRYSLKNINYSNIESVIDSRLNLLKQYNFTAYKTLVALSILGVKCYPTILESAENIVSNQFEQTIDTLVSTGFITQLNNLSYEFKSDEMWKIIVNKVKTDDVFEEILNSLYETLCIYKQSSLSLLAYILQKLNNSDKAFEIWTKLMKHSSYIGDIALYVITQKQALKLIENKTSAYYQKIKKNIHIRIGKLLEPIDFKIAFENLQTGLSMLDDNDSNINESIEILGYLASCSMKSGNYSGVIECIEDVLKKLPEDRNLEKLLVKSRLTKPLLKLGNQGQLINLIETELLPNLESYLSKNKISNYINYNEVFDIWLDIYYDLAEAVTFQGDNRAFEIIQNIYDILDKNKIADSTKACKIDLLLALANTIKGDTALSNKILSDILKENPLDTMDSFIVSRWNFIDILNKFFEKDYNTLQTELFNVAAYANNVNDNFTKNILKTLLAKMLKDNNQSKKALEILEEQVTYFAKEKVATGVLLSWYLIAKIKLVTSGTQFALDIATKALDIAKSPNINNYYFITLFNKLIGEIYLAKQDFESAKVYIEKSIFMAKQFDLQFILVKNYLLSAKLYQELALPKTMQRKDYIKQALKMFQLAKNTAIVENNTSLQRAIKEELNILTSFCRLNGIILKKDNK